MRRRNRILFVIVAFVAVLLSGSGSLEHFGSAALLALPAHVIDDFDADGRADATLFTTAGDWAILKSTGEFTASKVINWTAPGYIPVRGDFDGDNGQDPTLYNPLTGNWKILKSTSGYVSSSDVNWGGAGYAAVPGDYDGDGMADPAVYLASTGAWLILKSSTGYSTVIAATIGGPGWTPIGGQDFDGDSIADIVVYRQSTGIWSVLE